MRRSANSAAVIVAPVGPALTSASELPSATSAAARTTEACERERTAATGSSALVISSEAAIELDAVDLTGVAQRFEVAEDPQPDAVGGSRARAGDRPHRLPRSAPRPSRATVTAKGYSSASAAVSRGADSPISCLITSRPA